VVATTHAGAIYKGLAIGSHCGRSSPLRNRLPQWRVDVFNSTFKLLNNPAAFVDPNLPEGYGPFGIQNLGGWIYVTYAKQDADREDEIAGPGLGVVDVYDSSGTFCDESQPAEH